jgi:heparin binding hemagglutinin HbhA
MPTIDDVRKASEQARALMSTALERPFLAAVGAGDVATQAVLEALANARKQVTDQMPNDVTELRDRLDPAELRKLVDQYAEAAQKLYQYLTEHGEETLDRLRSQPQFKKAVEQFDQAAQAAQQRAESAVGDARELADEVLGKVVRRTRSTGEKTARATERAADDLAEQVHEAGEQAAHDVRSTTRKAANRTNTARKTAATSSTTPKSSTTNRKPGTTK